MKIVTKKQSIAIKNSDNCTAYEYETNNKNINIAIIEISGRYPDNGKALNEECTLMCYVIEGSGYLVVNNVEYTLEQGSVVLIEPNEEYYYEGNVKLCMPSAPAWTPDQYRKILD